MERWREREREKRETEEKESRETRWPGPSWDNGEARTSLDSHARSRHTLEDLGRVTNRTLGPSFIRSVLHNIA